MAVVLMNFKGNGNNWRRMRKHWILTRGVVSALFPVPLGKKTKKTRH